MKFIQFNLIKFDTYRKVLSNTNTKKLVLKLCSFEERSILGKYFGKIYFENLFLANMFDRNGIMTLIDLSLIIKVFRFA